jgi:peptidyl-prolyl cis-trans isomerase B (cyclophilin B)
VGTPKRERQKANRQQRLEELAAERKKQDMKKGTIKWVSIIGGIAVLIVAFALLSNRKSDKKVTTTPTTLAPADGGSSTSAPDGASSTSVAASAGTTAAPLAAAPPTVPGKKLTEATVCPKADGSESRAIAFKAEAPMCIDAAKKYTAVVTTNKGSYTATLDAKKAPKAVNNFVVLARYHYFDITTCHRIIPNFVVQCGDPGTGPGGPGTGGPGYTFADELPAKGEYKIGSLAMANSGVNTNGSQFFLITGPDGAALPPNYSLFGQLDAGQEAIIKTLDAAGTKAGVPTKELVYIEKVEIKES